MGILREIVFDCQHPARLARFWVEVLDDFRVRPYGDVDIAELAAEGLTPESDPNVMVDGPGFNLCFQKAETSVHKKNRLHIDIASKSRSELLQRLCEMGAVIVDEYESHSWVRDPEGNDFCLTDVS